MRPSLFLLTLAVLIPAMAAAQQRASTLSLTILGDGTEAPLPDVMVRLPGLAIGSLSDPEGRVRIAGIPIGTHVVEIQRIGYRTERVAIEFVDSIVAGEVSLLLEPVGIAGVHASVEGQNRRLASMGFYERERTGMGRYLRREDLERNASSSNELSHALSNVPGLRLRRGPDGQGRVITSSRGAVSPARQFCLSQVILDGMRLANPDPPGFIDIDGIISIAQIEAVEWYSGPAQTPEQFNSTGSMLSVKGAPGQQYGPHCGTLVIWTRGGG